MPGQCISLLASSIADNFIPFFIEKNKDTDNTPLFFSPHSYISLCLSESFLNLFTDFYPSDNQLSVKNSSIYPWPSVFLLSSSLWLISPLNYFSFGLRKTFAYLCIFHESCSHSSTKIRYRYLKFNMLNI